jgi:hypothetical protein
LIIIAGREQPPAKGRWKERGGYQMGADDMARCLFGDEVEPLALSDTFPAGTRTFPLETRGYRVRGGARRGAMVEAYPDPRVQCIVEYIREQESIQAIHRLRLVHRAEPAEVLILSSVPLPITVDRLVSYLELIPSRIELAAARSGGSSPFRSMV